MILKRIRLQYLKTMSLVYLIKIYLGAGYNEISPMTTNYNFYEIVNFNNIDHKTDFYTENTNTLSDNSFYKTYQQNTNDQEVANRNDSISYTNLEGITPHTKKYSKDYNDKRDYDVPINDNPEFFDVNGANRNILLKNNSENLLSNAEMLDIWNSYNYEARNDFMHNNNYMNYDIKHTVSSIKNQDCTINSEVIQNYPMLNENTNFNIIGSAFEYNVNNTNNCSYSDISSTINKEQNHYVNSEIQSNINYSKNNNTSFYFENENDMKNNEYNLLPEYESGNSENLNYSSNYAHPFFNIASNANVDYYTNKNINLNKLHINENQNIELCEVNLFNNKIMDNFNCEYGQNKNDNQNSYDQTCNIITTKQDYLIDENINDFVCNKGTAFIDSNFTLENNNELYKQKIKNQYEQDSIYNWVFTNSYQLDNTNNQNLGNITNQSNDNSCELLDKLTSHSKNMNAVSSTLSSNNVIDKQIELNLEENEVENTPFLYITKNSMSIEGTNHGKEEVEKNTQIKNSNLSFNTVGQGSKKQVNNCNFLHEAKERTCDLMHDDLVEKIVNPSENYQPKPGLLDFYSQPSPYISTSHEDVDEQTKKHGLISISTLSKDLPGKSTSNHNTHSTFCAEMKKERSNEASIISKISLYLKILRKTQYQDGLSKIEKKNFYSYLNLKYNGNYVNKSSHKNTFRLKRLMKCKNLSEDKNIFDNKTKALKPSYFDLERKKIREYNARRKKKFFYLFGKFLKNIEMEKCDKCFLYAENNSQNKIIIGCMSCNYEKYRKNINDYKNHFNIFELDSNQFLHLDFRRIFQIINDIYFYEPVINFDDSCFIFANYHKTFEIIKKYFNYFNASDCFDIIEKILKDFDEFVKMQNKDNRIYHNFKDQVTISILMKSSNGNILNILNSISIILSAVQYKLKYMNNFIYQFTVHNFFHLFIFEPVCDLFDLLSFDKTKTLFFNYYVRVYEIIYILVKLQSVNMDIDSDFFAALEKFIEKNNAKEEYIHENQIIYNRITAGETENDFSTNLDIEFQNIEKKVILYKSLNLFTNWKYRNISSNYLINISNHVTGLLSNVCEEDNKFKKQKEEIKKELTDLSYQLYIYHKNICCRFAEKVLYDKLDKVKIIRIKKNIYDCIKEGKYKNKITTEKKIKDILQFLHFFINFSYTLIENEIVELQKISEKGGFKRFY